MRFSGPRHIALLASTIGMLALSACASRSSIEADPSSVVQLPALPFQSAQAAQFEIESNGFSLNSDIVRSGEIFHSSIGTPRVVEIRASAWAEAPGAQPVALAGARLYAHLPVSGGNVVPAQPNAYCGPSSANGSEETIGPIACLADFDQDGDFDHHFLFALPVGSDLPFVSQLYCPDRLDSEVSFMSVEPTNRDRVRIETGIEQVQDPDGTSPRSDALRWFFQVRRTDDEASVRSPVSFILPVPSDQPQGPIFAGVQVTKTTEHSSGRYEVEYDVIGGSVDLAGFAEASYYMTAPRCPN
jgi:hypothetical protein